MTVFVLWDPRRPEEEFIPTIRELVRQGISNEIDQPELFNPVYNTISVEQSINLSHKRMVRTAKERGLPEVCILESDAMFPAIDGWDYFLANKPETFDIYLGGVYGLNQTARNRLEPGVMPLHNWEGMHCYIIHHTFYDKFLSVPDDQHIDVVLAGLGNFQVIYPFACIQRPGWSATSKKNMDYNTILDKKDVHGW